MGFLRGDHGSLQQQVIQLHAGFAPKHLALAFLSFFLTHPNAWGLLPRRQALASSCTTQTLLMLWGKKSHQHASHLIKIGFLDKHSSPGLIRKIQNDGQLLKPGDQEANLQQRHVHLQMPQKGPLAALIVMLDFRGNKCCSSERVLISKLHLFFFVQSVVTIYIYIFFFGKLKKVICWAAFSFLTGYGEW